MKAHFKRAENGEGDPRKLLDGLLAHFRSAGIFDGKHERYVRNARDSLAREGWFLSRDGYAAPDGPIYFRIGGRQAIVDAVTTLRRGEGGSVAQLTFARALAQALLVHVLTETRTPVPKESTFDHVWGVALEQLGLLPTQVPDVPGRTAVQRVLQSSREVAGQIERLWQAGAGPNGERTLPAGVTRELVLLLIREFCVFAEFVLAVLDRRKVVPAAQRELRWYTEDELVQHQQIAAEEARRQAQLLRERAMPA